jgi:maltooligosyltrehalose trehalohydrolase
VALFAPARCYGTPDSFRRFVDHAHALGLAVLLDVVYNHLGPDGAYLTRFSPDYFTDRYHSPWGAAVNLDGPRSARVREFFIENALHWLHEYHLDGVRLDATHALHDQGETHFLAELSARLHESTDRQVHVIAEDDRNLARMVMPQKDGGWGLDAVWADDFHHQMRRALAGDADGYYADYTGTSTDIATTIRQGWFYTGGFSRVLRAPRGTSAQGVAPQQCVVCLQNHDQIGNRAFGDRLHHRIAAAPYRAASTLLLMLPETPLLFMGQEWAASSPFLYFTDHHAELGRLVTAGRRREFRAFAAFANTAVLQSIPDPQADATFESSRLNWSEAATEPHASIRRLYATLLALRGELSSDRRGGDAATARAIGADTIALRRRATNGDALVICVRLRGAGPVTLDADMAAGTSRWSTVLTSEDAPFARDGNRPSVDVSASPPVIDYRGPAAVVLRAPSQTAS